MKQFPNANLRRLLTLAAVILLLTMCLTACSGKNDPDETVNNLPSGTGTSDSTDPVETTPPTTVPAPTTVWGTVNTDKLNVRTEASTDSTSVGKLAVNTRVEILETQVVGDVTWGRIENGWVNMTYITLDGDAPVNPPESSETTEPTAPPATEPQDPGTSTSGTKGTVTAEELNIRAGAGSTYEKVGTYKKGDSIVILETKDGWGRTDKGWVSLKYVSTGSTDTSTGTNTGTSTDTTGTVTDVVTDKNTTVLGYGVVNIGTLNVRSGPGTQYVVSAKVTSGQRLAYYQKSGSWVRIDKGWVSTKYFNIEGTVTAGTKGTVTASELNIRKEANSSSDVVGKYTKGDTVEILETSNNWGRTDKGWISLNYVTLETSSGTGSSSGTSTSSEVVTDSNKTALGYGVITTGELNVRTGPGTNYDKVTAVTSGQRFAYYQVSGDWVRIDKGWISAKYFYIEGTTGEKPGSGTVTGNEVNLRTGPGTSYESKGKVNSGDKVEILAQVTVGGKAWGYTKNGWICMDFVKIG